MPHIDWIHRWGTGILALDESEASMRIFVTGASGFVGGHVARTLAERHEVLAMARSEEGMAQVRALGATPVRCALGQVPADALAGVDAVVHCAARAEDWGTRQQFWDANVEGTRQLLEAARRAGVARFIHIGTEAALFHGEALEGVDETHPYPARHRFWYSESKAEAERLVLAADAPDMTTLSLRPRLVWGPGDRSVLPTLLDTAARGAFAWIDGGRARTSTTHVDNLVHAVELALAHGRGGQAYFVADDGERTMREFLARLVATRGVALPSRSVPGGLLRPLARVVEAVWGWLRPGQRPPITRFAASMMSRTVTVRTDKARRELGYAPRVTVEDGLRALEATG
jgi:nucleoside-diphosphate-sugar epimerase